MMSAHDIQSESASSGNLRAEVGLRNFIGASAALAVAVGLTGLAGQLWNIEYLSSPWPGFVAIKINTCIGFVLLGVSLWMRNKSLDNKKGGGIPLHAAQIFAFIVALVGLLSLSEIIFGWDLRIDQAIQPETLKEAFGSIRPGLMSPITALDFLLLGLSLGFLDRTTPRRRIWPSQLLSCGAVLLSLFSLMDFILAPHAFHTHIAVQTVVTFCVLSFAVFCMRPERGLSILVMSSGSREAILRSFLHRSGDESWKRYGLLRYGFSVAAVAVALVLSYLLKTYFGVTSSFLMFYPAVMLVTIIGGLGPGMFSILLSAFCAAYFFMEPLYEFQVSSLADVIALALFVFVCSCISLLAESVEWTRKRVQEQGRISAHYTRSLIEASLDPLVTISREGKITDVNQTTERATGKSRDELIGTDFCDYFTEPEKARQGYRQVFAEGAVHDYPLAIRSTSGGVTDVVYNASVFKNEAGEVAGVFAAARDITERKREEQARQESELRYRSLVTATAQIVWTTNALGEVVDDMPMWRDFTGMTREQIRGWGWLDSLHSDDRKRTAEIWTGAVRNRSIYDTEYRIRRHDGEYRTVAVRGVPVQDNDGSIREWIGTCTDITERKRAEVELAARAQDLARSNADLQQFAYVASHDLQEPLRMVASYTQLLAKRYRGKLDADADDFIGFAVDGAHRMQALVNDLLAYSRVGTRGHEFVSTEAETVLDTALSNLKASIEDNHAIISHDPLPTVPADATQFCQVFQNLIGNALKFHGPEPPRIHVSAQQQGGEWCFSVRDNGIGIDPQNSDRIFVIFQRLHAGREYPGTGIGLAITKKIVERHGGRIWVESEPGQGSTFSFTIPDVKAAYDNYRRAGASAGAGASD